MNPVLTSMIATVLLLAGTLFAGRYGFGALARVEGYSFHEQVFVKNNPAVTIRLCGLIFALFIATFGGYHPEGVSVTDDLSGGIAAFVAAFVALTISRYVNDYIILHSIDNNKEVVVKQNVAVAIIECATYLATAFIFAGGVADPDHGFIFNVTWFVFGQIVLIALAFLYRVLAPATLDRVATGNTACALSLAGLLLSGGIAVGALIGGTFESWAVDLARVGVSLLIWLVLMGLSRLVFYVSVASPSRLATELATEDNWAIGLINGLTFIAFTAAFAAIHT